MKAIIQVYYFKKS